MDEIELTRKTARAAQAQSLLTNELLKEAFVSLHDEYIANWKITHFKNVEARERLWQAVQIVGKVESHLKKMIQDGKLASQDLSRIKTLKR